MKPTIEWTEDWDLGIDISSENEISQNVLDVFVDFWNEAGIDSKSKSTMQRYRSALQSLGGYIVEESLSLENSKLSAYDLLVKYIEKEGGPLLFIDEETWQNELDMVCRKLYKYTQKKC